MHVPASRLFYKTHCCQRAFEIKFQIKIWEGMQMAPRGNVRGNTATIPLKFHVWIVASSFFLLELSRTKLCKFPTRQFPRWPDYKKKENHPLFLIHVTRVIFIKEKNFIYRSKGGEMIRDYLLLLSWLCAVQGKIGKYPDGDACVSAPF